MLLTNPCRQIGRIGVQSLRRSSSSAATDGLIYPESISSQHHDLPSFVEYASRIQMDPKSTVYVGTHYEYTARSSLERLGMSLKRIGGRSDYGIDLLGTWSLPSVPRPLKVLVQCKALGGKGGSGGPSQIRELEGAFVGAPQGWRDPGVLGLLVSTKSATKAVREALGRSRWPMGCVLCRADGKIMQFLWNRRAAQEGLEGISVELKYSGRGDLSEREVILTWRGEVISEPISL
ncbi:hypothetical protein M430DRAFT_96406 [Amorphotheca resinae ATCC 22711]|jgi:hypothetical protein|uniref:Restriction endonuclease type IV Mrr domain-containing protein n=1 Tax=Amorphotheca resinae ATCC 22711 TaxID=857342 RepID=A0A2T3BBT8_AMORE|nr:hypothetical protein M430DRAFT_96406 [Amorphotheca resinae ATCC 22711]PSS25724.1 hypothetical protein M430DRAFT_96406 [Amorphotheca resinae ATCC 22711]